jgi:hypothetical protein
MILRHITFATDPEYLRLKSFYLERFLQQLLFEVPSFHELLAFFERGRVTELQQPAVELSAVKQQSAG